MELENLGRRHNRHGASIRHPKLYGRWQGMLHRCYDRKRAKFSIYGGRGITVCEEWRDNPNAFIDWALSHGYQDGLQIDRINNNGLYSPDNCRWVTCRENLRNTRRNRHLTLGGDRRTVAEWVERLALPSGTVYGWLAKYGEGGCAERILGRILKERAARI